MLIHGRADGDDDFTPEFRSASTASSDTKSVAIDVSSSGSQTPSSSTFPYRAGFANSTPTSSRIDPDSLLSQPFDDDGIAQRHGASLLSLSQSSSGREKIWMYHRHKIIAAVVALILLIIIIAVAAR